MSEIHKPLCKPTRRALAADLRLPLLKAALIRWLALATLLPALAHTAEPNPLHARAKTFIERLSTGKFDEAEADYDAAMKAALPAAKLKETWETFEKQLGPFRNIGTPRDEEISELRVVRVPCSFEKLTLDARVVFDRESRVTGLFFVPGVGESRAPVPAYARRDEFDEQPVKVGPGEWELPGTISMPKGPGPFPAVVLVHGSGPEDQDETVGNAKPFRDLAWGLASRGIAAVRYEKRTKAHGVKMAGLTNFTLREETIDDAVAAADLLRRTPRIDASRLVILGHSLGGTAVPRIAQQDSKLAGFIVMAGFLGPLPEKLLEQNRYIAGLEGTISEDAKKQLDALDREIARLRTILKSGETPTTNILGAPVSYWRDLETPAPATIAAALRKPILVLQGGRDYQITMKDFEMWKEALKENRQAQFKSFPKLNHLFIAGEGKSAPNEYDKPGNVVEEVVSAIAEWIGGLK